MSCMPQTLMHDQAAVAKSAWPHAMHSLLLSSTICSISLSSSSGMPQPLIHDQVVVASLKINYGFYAEWRVCHLRNWKLWRTKSQTFGQI